MGIKGADHIVIRVKDISVKLSKAGEKEFTQFSWLWMICLQR